MELIAYIVGFALAVLATNADGTTCVPNNETDCIPCGIKGNWINDLGSNVEFSCHDGIITGKYNSAVGHAQDYYKLSGGYTRVGPGRNDLIVGWTVAFNNKVKGNSNSTASFTGVYYASSATIVTTWILTRYTDSSDMWMNSRIGKNVFSNHTNHTPTTGLPGALLSAIYSDSSCIPGNETDCIPCGIKGNWINDLGSKVKFTCHDGIITGKYNSAVGHAQDYYKLSGGYTRVGPGLNDLIVGWTVAFNNKVKGNSNSTASFTGVYYASNATIVTTWILTRYTDPADMWMNSRIGKNVFTRVTGSLDTSTAASVYRHHVSMVLPVTIFSVMQMWMKYTP